jgi:hypothetical protein
MVTQGMLAARAARPPLKGESAARPLKDEVNVFRDFFLAGLRFPYWLMDMQSNKGGILVNVKKNENKKINKCSCIMMMISIYGLAYMRSESLKICDCVRNMAPLSHCL